MNEFRVGNNILVILKNSQIQSANSSKGLT